MISSYRGFTAWTRTRSLALSAAARNRPPYCIRGVAPTIAIERGLSILWIDAICGSVQNCMTPPEKNVTPQLVYPTADLRVNPNAPRDIRFAFDEACNCYRAGAFK